MKRNSVVLILIVAMCGIGLLYAQNIKRKNAELAAAKAVSIAPSPKLQRFQVPTMRLDEPMAVKKNTAANQTEAVQVVFNDDFEGGKGRWQAGAAWGIRATAGGYVDEKTSDWGSSKTNFHSATTSAYESGATPSSTDMLMSPGFVLPTTVDNGAPLARLNLDFWIDWDAANAANRVYVYLGKDIALWKVENTAPGAGAKSWEIHNPGVAPYDVFSRQYLTTPEIDLTGVAAPISLSFLYKSVSEPEFDFNKVDVYTKDDNFQKNTSVASFDGPDGSAGGGTAAWKNHSVSLDAYAGKVIKLRFSENGDYGAVQAGAVFGIDDVTVTGPGGVVFKDDGGETAASAMTAEGFAAGNAVAAYQGVATPNPTWIHVAVAGNLLLTGGSGTLKPGDHARLGVVFAYDPAGGGAPHTVGRGLFIDDVNLTGQTIQDDVAAVSVVVPFPAKTGDALTFSLNVKNNGVNPQSNVQWQGNILDASGAQIASVVGRRTDAIAPGATVAIPAITNWTAGVPGVYRVRAFTRLTSDEDRSNDSTFVANDDANGTGDARYSPFVVHEKNVLFSSALYNAPASPSAAQLVARGFVVRSAPEPGVVTWQTTASALVPELNNIPGYKGAYIQFDSLGRVQDEELIIPNLDFSTVTSNATLSFKGLGTGGFGGYTRFSIGVSSDGGLTWTDVFERLRGVDPQTGQNYGGAALFTASMRPGVLNITRWAAGRPNVHIRFRYQSENFDGDWLVWSVAVAGRGIQAANLTSAADIPNDQGKQVRLLWDRSANDGQLAGVPIAQYGVWRQVPGTTANSRPVAGDIVVENRAALLADIASLKPGTRFYESATAITWDFLGSVLARSEPNYGFVAPTLRDSVAYNFMVSAHTTNPLVFGNSNVIAGTSIDNLAPNAVQLSGKAESGFLQLNWTEPDNEEAKFYSVYRRLPSEPSFGTPIAKLGGREFRDTNIQKNTTYIYAVTATDFGSNESKRSNELPVTATAVAAQNVELPTNYAIAQNYPNPFNPTTMIAYQIPKAGEVKLTIINSLGQKVRTLVAGQVAAGYHQALWDARDDNGNFVGSGTYLYRIEAGDFVQTKKLVLMK